MHIRYLLIAATGLAIANAAAAADPAAPAKPDARETAQPVNRPAAVVLASADQVQAPAPDGQQQAATPAKRPRAARVTTCRCGDQTNQR